MSSVRPWYLTHTCFFFSSRRRHTRSDRDWSSDVCSSDLSEMLKLRPYQKGLLTAIPLLVGALFRPVLGFLGERVGERRTGLLGLALTLLPLILAWRFSHTAAHFYFLGLLPGVA